jgi:hypothetical protein
MRRFLTLISLLCLAIPAGVSISGCSRDPGADYCNGLGYGLKIDQVSVITLQPATTGISMAYGQTRTVTSPAATTCKGTSASVSSYSYGTTNNQLVDIAPSGNMCAGTWNRNTGGGIANYTICSAPNPLPSTGGLPYAVAYITASAQSVVSNAVPVFVHAPATSVSLVTSGSTGQQCYSQGTQATLDAQVCFAGTDNKQYLLCAPSSVTSNFVCPLPAGVTSVPSCSAAVGILSYSVSNTAIATVTSDTITNQATITAAQPGTTPITASLSTSGSSAGFFSTCPPKSISLTLANGGTSGTITQGVTQNLVTTVYDNNLTQCPGTGCPITGMTLTYQSTDPVDISVSGTGSISTSYPGVASVYAVCEPSGCNPAPLYEEGLFGTGLPISSNAVKITTPGTASDYLWFGAPGQSQYIFPVDLLTGTVGTSARLPYVPNSMVVDPLGNAIYLGSPHAMMIFSTSSDSVSTPNTNLPGVVLAVSPDASTVLVNDQERQVFYLFNSSANSISTFGGMGNAAAWTPDSKTLYITDNAALNNASQGITGHTDTLYIYNANTGWVTYGPESIPASPLPQSPLPNNLPPGVLPISIYPTLLPAVTLPANVAISSTVQNPAITIPSVGAYLRGIPTEAHTWCPTGTVGDYNSMAFYPASGDSFAVQTDVLTATTDGNHILGAAVTGGGTTLTDIAVDIVPAECSLATALSTNGELVTTTPLAVNVSATAVNRIIASPASNLAFITYTALESNTNALLPYYQPNTTDPTQLGTVGYVTLSDCQATISGVANPSYPCSSNILAPLAGIFTPDDKYFFVSTAGDNMIHQIDVPTLTDKLQFSPNLPACTPVSAGGTDLGCTYTGPNPGTAVVPATTLAVKPRSTT